jgi:hypothetical protein
LQTFCISHWQSEPHQQHQNAAERRYQNIKRSANRLLDRTGAPANTWLLCLQYVCYLFNHTYNDNIKSATLNCLPGVTVDISALLRFHFLQKVYYKNVHCGFPSNSTDSMGYIVGISEHCGMPLLGKSSPLLPTALSTAHLFDHSILIIPIYMLIRFVGS